MSKTFQIRQIPKNPHVPDLSIKAIELLTKLCFREDDPIQESDLVFVFSTSIYEKQLAEIITKYLDQKLATKVFLTGGSVAYEDVSYNKLTECDLVLQNIPTEKFPAVVFFTERKSTNTSANITEALKIFDFSKLEKIMFIFKSHAAGRGYLTLRKYLPETQLIQSTFSVHYPESIGNEELTRENWFKSQFGRERVWGEYLRILVYGEKGDLDLSEASGLIDQIEKEVNS